MKYTVITFLFCLLIGFNVSAQQDALDSTYTAMPPPGYQIPPERLDAALIALEEELYEEIVPSAVSDPDMYQLQFDTAMAMELIEVDLEDYYVPRVSEQLIRDRLSCIENRVPLVYHDRVKLFIDFYAVRRRDFTLRVMQRKNLYFPLFEKILAEYGMPDELKYLAIIESALIPTARSRVGAQGLWQFMPATGRQFGLKQTSYIDERQDPEQATRAACQYLKQLYGMFGSWELAISSYNCGPGNVRKAVRRSGYRNSFWGIYQHLPRETRSYLPQFVAMMYVLNYAEEHHLIQDQPDYPIPASTVYVSGKVDLGLLGDELNICPEDLLLLNPSLKLGMVPPYAENYPLQLPNARYGEFLDRRQEILAIASQGNTYTSSIFGANGSPDPRYDGTYYHIVRKGESLLKAAGHNGVTVEQLKEWNRLSNERVYPGQKLLVYTGSQQRPKTTSSTGNYEYHRVRSGEVLGSIARKYRVYVSQIKAWNGLRGDNIYVGQRLRIKAPKGASSSSKTASTVKPSTPPKGATQYTVRSGDALGEIASKHGISVTNLRAWNNISGNTIYPGQKLWVVNKTTASTPVAATSSSTTPSYHTVRNGETLSEIAVKYNLSVKYIQGLNSLSGVNIKVGQRLKLKGSMETFSKEGTSSNATASSTYIVKSGDSLWTIASKFSTTVTQLKSLNGISSSQLKVGQKLKIK